MKSYLHIWHSLLIITISLVAILMLSGSGGCTKEPISKDDPQEEPFVRLLEDQTLESKLLNFPVNYAVLLPEEYELSTDSFPVIYLLHGYGDNHTAWYKGGSIQYYADQNINQTGPTIYVMPQGFNSYYVNKYNGYFPYMDMFVDELVPTIDSLFRTKKSNTQRAVMGYSMGGYGALILPAMNPDVFSISVPLSMSFRTDEQYMTQSQDGWNAQFGSVFGGSGTTGAERLNDYYKAHSPFHFFDKDDLSQFSELKLFLDCGDDEESLHITNGELHNLLRNREFNHEYRVRNGGHSWNYWHASLKEAFKFIGYGFRGIPYPEEPTPIEVGETVTANQYSFKNLSGITESIGVFVPENYESVTESFPVIYFLHDNENQNREDNLVQLLSLLNNKMKAGDIPNSIIIEILMDNNDFTSSTLSEIQDQINSNYRTKVEKQNSVVIANGIGGEKALDILADNPNLFNGCFMFNSKIPNESAGIPGVFFYVDLTDNSISHTGNYNLFINLWENEIRHEYRVRQGDQSFQSFLNGLENSVSLINVYLKN
ncbi:MAG: hypothetical protein CVT98_00885 [Bacteroidetes bacterium HGW-Bacteroidetes-15]|nr:MAG: hypothetical protein CVT98_00885 [Bacteroidetes bacterium HGW-Bacteroidetes-15]